jgi:hypothetical protein
LESSFSAIINAPIEKVDIPGWCFSLPDSLGWGSRVAKLWWSSAQVGLRSRDVVVSVVANPLGDWSFGVRGAGFLDGERSLDGAEINPPG